MRLRITRELPPRFNGFDTARLQQDQTYEVGQVLADLLIARGFAVSADLTKPGVLPQSATTRKKRRVTE